MVLDMNDFEQTELETLVNELRAEARKLVIMGTGTLKAVELLLKAANEIHDLEQQLSYEEFRAQELEWELMGEDL